MMIDLEIAYSQGTFKKPHMQGVRKLTTEAYVGVRRKEGVKRTTQQMGNFWMFS